ncbi:MAG: PaaI family thioesterase [Sphingobium sp.]
MTTHSLETLAADGWLKFGGDMHAFSGNVAPFWFREGDRGLSLLLKIEARHCNEHLGTMHGGALMTFADIAGGFAVARALGHQRLATIQLQTHFTAAARQGDFVQCAVEIVRQTTDIVFIRGTMEANGRTVISFDGIWKVLAER